MQTRRDYTMAAHFAYLRRLMPKVGKWRFFLDQDPGMRAAVMSAFVEEIKAETCDAWFVRINKDLTIDKRRQARRIARLQFESVKAANPGLSDREVVREMIKTAHAAMTQHGNWNDRWLDHPYPNMSEPEKAVSWLTERPTFTPDHAASLYAMASLHGVDSLFNQMRRRSRLLERPIHTSSGSGRRIRPTTPPRRCASSRSFGCATTSSGRARRTGRRRRCASAWPGLPSITPTSSPSFLDPV